MLPYWFVSLSITWFVHIKGIEAGAAALENLSTPLRHSFSAVKTSSIQRNYHYNDSAVASEFSHVISPTAIGDLIAHGFGISDSRSVPAGQASRFVAATSYTSTRVVDHPSPVSAANSSTLVVSSAFGTLMASVKSHPSSSIASIPSNTLTTVTQAKISNSTSRYQTISALDDSGVTPDRSINTTSLSRNTSSGLDACWAQWSSYWVANPNARETSYTTVSMWTTTSTEPAVSALTYTETIVGTTFTASAFGGAGGFVWPTLETITVDAETTTITYPAEPAITVISLDFSIIISNPPVLAESQNHSITTPACALPSLVPQCQSQWASYESLQLLATAVPEPSCPFDDYFSASCSLARASASSASASFSSAVQMHSPLCSQATIGSALCTQLRDYYIKTWVEEWIEADGAGPYAAIPLSSAGYQLSWSPYPDGGWYASTYFPTTSTLAPGCTLGCARCAITGGLVRLLYWPTTATSAQNDSNSLELEVVSDPLTAVALGTTFTSPTNYISYASVYAQDSCSAIGSIHGPTILAIPTTVQLSSLFVTWPDLMPHTAPFNFTDLNPPIPESIYSRQLRCTAFYPDRWIDYEPLESLVTRTCPQTLGPYEPIIVVPSQILQSIDPAWSTCSGDIRGLYDPPYALHGAAAAATPTSSNFVPSTAPIKPAPAPWIETLPTHTPSSVRPSASPDYKNPTIIQPLPGNAQPPTANSLLDGDPSLGADPLNRVSILTGIISGSNVPNGAGSPGDSSDEGPGDKVSSNDRGSSSSEGDPGSGDPDNGSVAKDSSDGDSGDSRFPIENSKSHNGRPASGASSPSPPSPTSSLNSPNGVVIPETGEGGGRDSTGQGDDTADSISGGEIIAILRTGSDNEGAHGQPDESVGPARNGESIAHGTAFDPTSDKSDSGNFAQEEPILAVVGGQTISGDPEDPGAAIIASSTLFAGGPAVTLSGRIISMASSGLVVGGTAHQFSRIPDATRAPTDFEASFTILGKAYAVYEDRKHPETAVVVAANGVETTRLRSGDPVATIGGQRISLDSAGVMVGSSEVPFHIASVHDMAKERGIFADAKGHVHTIVMELAADVAVVDGSKNLTRYGPRLTVDGDFVTWGSDGVFVDNTPVIFKSITATGWPDSVPKTTDIVGRPSTLGVMSSLSPSETRAQAGHPSSSKKVLEFDSTPLFVVWCLVLVFIYLC